MTLRLRLVAALFVLVLAGLGLFGVATYTLYSRSQYTRLDEQIQSAVPFVVRQLTDARPPIDGPGRGERDPGPRPGPVPLATYAELRDAEGKLIKAEQLADTSGAPELPSRLRVDSPAESRFLTTGSTEGSGTWRAYVTPSDGNTVVVAVPTDEITHALDRLVLIETTGGAGLLALLSLGAWLVLRRGLRPLEEMAGTAGEIAAGDLSQRVSLSNESTEVGRLGLALNTMLDEIEAAFAERAATEDRLRQFLADASHELRTPLTSIQGFAELFRIGDGERVDLPTILRRIEQESARMRVLVDDLLVLARLDQTRLAARTPVDLAVLAADACTDAVGASPDRRVTLDAPEPVVVLGDPALLRQAIANIVGNAVRHTPPATPVDVSARLVDGSAVVVVRDHGSGLDAEALEHVFDRFWQADRARAGVGAGLGLSIVWGVAAEHGGSVDAANAEGGGAVFTLRLPLA